MSFNGVGSVHGLPVRGTIRSINLPKGIVYVSLPHTQSDTLYPVKIPAGWVGSKGEISAGYPSRGTPIFCIQGQGNEWMFVGYDQPDARRNYDSDGTRRVSSLSKLREGRWITLVQNDVVILADPKDGVVQGGSIQHTQADPGRGIWSSRFLQEMHFTDAHRNVTGPIKRDLGSNSSRNVSGSALYGHPYNSSLTTIGLDPRTAASVSTESARNPGLTESRNLYYEFIDSFGYTNDENETRLYGGEDLPETKPFQRKKSRTDAMSLSLDHPNFLLETILGTVVDIYGNILDLNRSPLPNGIIDSLSFRKAEEDNDVVFGKLRDQLRKSIAYHFELNARKEGNSSPDYTNIDDYIRARSRFFIDIDKEGQFKVNVPSSSEIGNVPVLTRYENFSNLKGSEEETDRGQFLRNATDNTDIKLDPYGKGVISLVSNEESLKSFAAPINRIDGEVIKLGTAFHDISGGLVLHKFDEPYRTNEGYINSLINFIEPVQDIVSSEIIVSGEGANAGGRSGTVALDGFLSLSIGANTIDRQSLWLDCAGGIVTAIGRDKNQRSVVATLDGDLLMQVGGSTISDDSRFPSASFNNEVRDGVIDIRVWNSGSFHTIRIDNQGIKIHTPQRIDIVSEGEMRFKSIRSNMYFDAESIFFYANEDSGGRLVQRKSGVTI